jgi:hypothetical protein
MLWNLQICRFPMKHAAERIQNDLGEEKRDITMKYRGQDSKDPTRDARAMAPDWCTFLSGRPEDGDKPIIAV